ncbi:restriction endonuclease subunit S [Lacticaseibacillus paracasei]|uniref:restriction endonuclease subunit S n=1 Tax=Lacticaseibacillus paracasei TaxID=1597 RepID=UPI00202FFED4|nr:restriction endonuclease subunit S [Lacticaseibacillus paracasei]URW90660.1 restriction endonuclease subunit S [Lacticaseibacillus paracasei]
MSKDAKNVPALRFKGYSDAWEKRKLGEVLFERNSRSGAKQLLSVTINQGVIKAEDSGRKDNSSSDLSNYKLVKVGDIPYNSMRMWQGASGYSYFEGIVSPAYTVLIPSAETDGLFLSYDIKRNKMLSVFQRHSQGLTSDTWNLKYPQLSSIHVRVPKKNEQKQIRQALIKLDDLIAATQRRIDALEQAKKALLQRLFDQSWRFKGYSDPWEKRKLGDIFYQVSFFVNPEDAKLELWSLTVAEGLTPKSIRYDRNFLVRKQDKFKVVHSEDFVYNPMNITLGALDQNKLLKSVAVSGYYTTMSINRGFDGSFFKFLLSSPLMIRKYKNYATGSLLEKQRVQFSTFSIINIKAPKFDEQNKIGNFLIKLDHLIAATQSRLSSLELLKKALLQDLFI